MKDDKDDKEDESDCVRNEYGVRVKKWCASCVNHTAMKSDKECRCRLLRQTVYKRSKCDWWEMQPHLRDVGNPMRVAGFWKPKAYFDWLLENMDRLEELGIKWGKAYVWWRRNVRDS